MIFFLCGCRYMPESLYALFRRLVTFGMPVSFRSGERVGWGLGLTSECEDGGVD